MSTLLQSQCRKAGNLQGGLIVGFTTARFVVGAAHGRESNHPGTCAERSRSMGRSHNLREIRQRLDQQFVNRAAFTPAQFELEDRQILLHVCPILRANKRHNVFMAEHAE